jgi:hypothetical protein
MGQSYQDCAFGGQVSLNLGGVLLGLRDASSSELRLNRELALFQKETYPSDVQITIERAVSLHLSKGRAIFDSGAVWNLFREDSAWIFDFCSPVFGPQPYKRLRMGNDFRAGELILSSQLREQLSDVCPLEYPADELLITNYLAHHGLGIEVHGCGLIDSETSGHLFLGHSGAGKSTTARMWETFRAPEILSDDRIILRLHNGELWMYGTPWHGEAAFASPAKAKLNRIHILRQGSENRITTLPQARAVGEIFARSFPPFHSPAGLEKTIEFIKHALDVVPCYEFEFVPDKSAVAAVVGFRKYD